MAGFYKIGCSRKRIKHHNGKEIMGKVIRNGHSKMDSFIEPGESFFLKYIN